MTLQWLAVEPSGTKDGSNTIFLLPFVPLGKIILIHDNAMLLEDYDFSITSQTITFLVDPPLAGSILSAYCLRDITVGGYVATAWTASTAWTVARLNNFETIHDEFITIFEAHTHDFYTRAQMESTFWYAGNDGDGSGADADYIYRADGNLHASSFSGLGAPTGLIVMWYGIYNDIPSGWHLCDGTAGTRDLRNRFIIGAGDTFSVGDTGGSSTFTASGSLAITLHTITVAEMPSHRHPFLDNQIVDSRTTGPGTNFYGENKSRYGTTNSTGSNQPHGHTGSTVTGSPVDIMPPYYALCYIQKI